MKKLTEAQEYIISEALKLVHYAEDIDKVLDDAEGTVLGIDKKAMRILKEAAEAKVAYLNHQNR